MKILYGSIILMGNLYLTASKIKTWQAVEELLEAAEPEGQPPATYTPPEIRYENEVQQSCYIENNFLRCLYDNLLTNFDLSSLVSLGKSSRRTEDVRENAIENKKLNRRKEDLDSWEGNIADVDDTYYGSSWYYGYYFGSWSSSYQYPYYYDDSQWYYSQDSSQNQYGYEYYQDANTQINSQSKITQETNKIDLQKSNNSPTKPHKQQETSKAHTSQYLKVEEDNLSHKSLKKSQRLRGTENQPARPVKKQNLLRKKDAYSDLIKPDLNASVASACCILPPDQCNIQGVACPLNTNQPVNYDPVCGCDGKTYSNACYAENFGCVRSWTRGECRENPSSTT